MLLDSIGFGIIMPVVPHLIMDISGDTLTNAARTSGFLMFAFAGMQFIFIPGAGQPIRPLRASSGAAVLFIGDGLQLPAHGLGPDAVLAFCRAYHSAGCLASTYGIANAYIADTFPADKRGAVFRCY